MTSEPTIRRDLRPGDLGRIVAHHGEVYLPAYGLDSSFEAGVAESTARAGARGFPGPREGIWIVEHEGRHAGSIALTDEGGDLGQIRWVLLDPSVRGRGLGRRLVGEAVELSRAVGHQRIELVTFSDLTTAAAIYRSFGFELAWEQPGPRWGRTEFIYQGYELSFQSRAQSSSSPRTGASARPFSVSA